ncbi:MAG: sodium/glutamate symporter, partial [Cyanobacteriota bacterium]
MSALPAVGGALAALACLLLLGKGIGGAIGLRLWGVPEALVAGALGLLVAPSGPWPLLPQVVIEQWNHWPLILLTLVFASLLLGKPLPSPGGLWRPLSAQLLLALTLAFGQYFVAGLLVLLVLQPWLGVHPLMACLIEVSYEGGHGSAAAMGPTYARLGFEGGAALGLAMATVGLLSSTLVGGAVVVLARRLGWLTPTHHAAITTATPAATSATTATTEATSTTSATETATARAAAAGPAAPTVSAAETASAWAVAAAWAVNLALTGLAVLLGWGSWQALRWVAPSLGSG